MKRLARFGLLAVVVAAAANALPATAHAATLAGNGYSSSYVGESIFTTKGPGESGQFSVIFANDGTQLWSPGAVGLLICLPDKTTCGVPSPNAAYASRWYSSTVYTSVTTNVLPGQNGFFTYAFVVPAAAAFAEVATFNGEVGLIASGLALHPEGYFHRNVTPAAFGSLAISPLSAAVPQSGQQQFTAFLGGVPASASWSVTGGCGIISSTGLLVGTSINSNAQPCSVVARTGGLSASAAVVVYGPAALLACSPASLQIAANGGDARGGTATVTVSAKDLSGNTVVSGAPTITVANSTPLVVAVTPLGSMSPTSGVASLTLASTTATGQTVISAAASGITGCTTLVTSNAPGLPARSVSGFTDDPLAADGTSNTLLRVDLLDAGGSRTLDSVTTIDVSRGADSSFVCSLTGTVTGTSSSVGPGAATATAINGRVEFRVLATTTPGVCTFTATPRATSIAPSSATLTTRSVSAAAKLLVSGSDSPHAAGSSSLTTVTVDVQDAAGQRVTSSTTPITPTLDSATCTGEGGGNVFISSYGSTTNGRALFQFTSFGAYPGCTVTFTAGGLSPATSFIAFMPGDADHLGCAFTPTSIRNDGSTASARVTVRDRAGNKVAAGSYSVAITRTAGGGSTSVVTYGSQTMSAGVATFLVSSTPAFGADTYTPVLMSGSLPNAVANTSCTIAVQ